MVSWSNEVFTTTLANLFLCLIHSLIYCFNTGDNKYIGIDIYEWKYGRFPAKWNKGIRKDILPAKCYFSGGSQLYINFWDSYELRRC